LLGKDGASREEPREWKEWLQWRERSRQYAIPQQGAARIQGSKSGADDSHTDYSELGAGLAAAAGMAGGADAASGHLWQEDVDSAMPAGGAPALADDCLSRQTNPVYAHEPDNIYHGTSIDPTANFSDTIGMGLDFGSGSGFNFSESFGSGFDNSTVSAAASTALAAALTALAALTVRAVSTVRAVLGQTSDREGGLKSVSVFVQPSIEALVSQFLQSK
jgi:hypothetical protein